MKGIYLAAFRAAHNNYDIVYQDIDGKRDIGGDMMDIDLSPYDFIIATPPCNYWSICNYRRNNSKYALATKHLLPEIINKLCKLDKPFIVENVRNKPLFDEYKLYDFPCFVYIIGRHTYWTNILLPAGIPQRQDFLNGGRVIMYDDMKDKSHQGGYNVHQVIEVWLSIVTDLLKE
jgi:site-specific DNA-cytosine methylase